MVAIMYQYTKELHLFLVSLTENFFSLFEISIEMIPIRDTQNEQWDLFENAATHSYARSVLEKTKNKDNLITDDTASRKAMTSIEYVDVFINSHHLIMSFSSSDIVPTTDDQRQSIVNLKEELMSTFKSVLTESQKGLEQVQKFDLQIISHSFFHNLE